MAGFCPVGPWIVTADELDPADLRLGCTVNGAPIQDGRTAQMRFAIAEMLAFLQPPRRAPAGRPDRDRHARPRSPTPPARTSTSGRATS